MAAATTATITAPCGVDLDDGGHSAAWAEHLRECGSCNRWDIDHRQGLTMSHTFSLTVTHAADAWTVTHISDALVTTTKTLPAACSAARVLHAAARMASGDVLWQVTDGGFEAVVRSDVTGWPLPAIMAG